MSEKKSAGKKSGNFLWNPDTKEFLARTYVSWAKVGLFYVCFYTGLGLFFWANMAIFFTTMDKRQPKYYGVESQTLGNPGVGYRPMPDSEMSLIKFAQGDEGSFGPYTSHLKAFLRKHTADEPGKKTIDCSQLRANEARPKDGSLCTYGPEVVAKAEDYCGKSGHFGYDLGEPCVLLKMNKLYGWTPETYSSLDELLSDQNQAKRIPRFISFEANNSVGIGCDGENEVDRENLKNVEFYPKDGFSKHFYPYMNENGYKSPLVFAKFKEVTKRVAIMIECKLFAKNIANSGGNENHGTTRFVLVID